MRNLLRIKVFLLLIALFFSSSAHAEYVDLYAERDSMMAVIEELPNDSARLQKIRDEIEDFVDRAWALEVINYGLKLAESNKKQREEFALLCVRARLAANFCDWKRVREYLKPIRKKVFDYKCFDVYASAMYAIGVTASNAAQYEFAWKCAHLLESDLKNAGGTAFIDNGVWIYMIRAAAYLCKGDAKKSIEMNLQALGGNLKMNVKQKLNIYNLIIEQYMSLHEYEKALVYSDSSLYVYDYYYNVERKDEKPDPKMLALIRYVAAKVHYNLDNYEQMRAALEFASSVYTFPGETTAEILYLWSKYYYSKKDYERSLEFLEKSVGMHRQYSQPYLWMQLEIDKTNTLRAMGREEEAFDLYVKFLEAYSSENNAMLRAQQSYLGDEISELDKLEQHEYINTWKVRVFGFVAVITVVILLFLIVYVIRAHRKILGNYNVTVQKLHEANLADKEKEHFLHNITKLINEPLQYVVQSAKLLAEDTTLTDEEKDTLVVHNKEQVGMLLKLVNNVLDLSRLEACMMKYEARNIDIVEQILDFIAKYNNHYPNARIQSEYLVDSYSMEMDVQRFVNMLNSLFPVPKENETITEERCIKVEPDGKKLVITVTGSPYGDESDFAESEKMVNKINRYVMRDFNSTYEIKDNHDIVITLNKV